MSKKVDALLAAEAKTAEEAEATSDIDARATGSRQGDTRSSACQESPGPVARRRVRGTCGLRRASRAAGLDGCEDTGAPGDRPSR